VQNHLKMRSIFTDKNREPNESDLLPGIGNESLMRWNELANYAALACKGTCPEWSFGGDKYGWSFRIKDKKRAIIYLLPRDGFFKAAFVFGDRACEAIFKSSVSELFKKELQEARKYAEGRGIRIPIMNDEYMNDIKELIRIKVMH
jgi:hypothetical protein